MFNGVCWICIIWYGSRSKFRIQPNFWYGSRSREMIWILQIRIRICNTACILFICIQPVLNPSCPASLLLCIPPALHPSFSASLLFCIPPVLHPSCTTPLLFCIPPFLHLSCLAFQDLDTNPKKYCIWWVHCYRQCSICQWLLTDLDPT